MTISGTALLTPADYDKIADAVGDDNKQKAVSRRVWALRALDTQRQHRLRGPVQIVKSCACGLLILTSRTG